MPFASPFGLGGALNDPPSLFGEIAWMKKLSRQRTFYPESERKYEGLNLLIY